MMNDGATIRARKLKPWTTDGGLEYPIKRQLGQSLVSSAVLLKMDEMEVA